VCDGLFEADNCTSALEALQLLLEHLRTGVNNVRVALDSRYIAHPVIRQDDQRRFVGEPTDGPRKAGVP
jgi:hypothetical protein